MKLRYFWQLSLIAIPAVCLFYACHKELPISPPSHKSDLTVSEARSWFSAKQKDIPEFDDARKGKSGNPLKYRQITPWWKHLKHWKLPDNKQILEVPPSYTAQSFRAHSNELFC